MIWKFAFCPPEGVLDVFASDTLCTGMLLKRIAQNFFFHICRGKLCHRHHSIVSVIYSIYLPSSSLVWKENWDHVYLWVSDCKITNKSFTNSFLSFESMPSLPLIAANINLPYPRLHWTKKCSFDHNFSA